MCVEVYRMDFFLICIFLDNLPVAGSGRKVDIFNANHVEIAIKRGKEKWSLNVSPGGCLIFFFLYFFRFLRLSVFLSPSLSLIFYVSRSLSFFLPFSVSVCLPLFIFMPDSFSLSLHFFLSAFFFLSLSRSIKYLINYKKMSICIY